MTTARDIMTGGVQCVDVNETLVQAAQKMRDLGVGALPICGEDHRLKGMLTDRDIVVNCVADGIDPGTKTAATWRTASPSRSVPTTRSRIRCTP